MPCYEVRTMSVEFRAENRDLLKKAIQATNILMTNWDGDRVYLAYGKIVLNLGTGTATLEEGFQDRLNELKRAYSKECIKAAAKKVQWSVKMTGNEATVTKMKW